MRRSSARLRGEDAPLPGLPADDHGPSTSTGGPTTSGLSRSAGPSTSRSAAACLQPSSSDASSAPSPSKDDRSKRKAASETHRCVCLVVNFFHIFFII